MNSQARGGQFVISTSSRLTPISTLAPATSWAKSAH